MTLETTVDSINIAGDSFHDWLVLADAVQHKEWFLSQMISFFKDETNESSTITEENILTMPNAPQKLVELAVSSLTYILPKNPGLMKRTYESLIKVVRMTSFNSQMTYLEKIASFVDADTCKSCNNVVPLFAEYVFPQLLDDVKSYKNSDDAEEKIDKVLGAIREALNDRAQCGTILDENSFKQGTRFSYSVIINGAQTPRKNVAKQINVPDVSLSYETIAALVDDDASAELASNLRLGNKVKFENEEKLPVLELFHKQWGGYITSVEPHGNRESKNIGFRIFYGLNGNKKSFKIEVSKKDGTKLNVMRQLCRDYCVPEGQQDYHAISGTLSTIMSF